MYTALNKKHLSKISQNIHLYRHYNAQSTTLPEPKQQRGHITNEFGVQMINEKLRSYLFGNKCVDNSQDDIEKAKKHLKKFDLLGKTTPPLRDVANLKLPKLKGNNIEEHIMIIANTIKNKYYKFFCLLASSDIPKMPTNFEFSPGWTRYDPHTNKTTKVAYPPDESLVFDVETLVPDENRPVMAVAASDKAWYSWCSDMFFQENYSGSRPLELNDLIPFESEDAEMRKRQHRIFIGHNVGFDRSYIREQYYIEKSKLRFLDTMSMHIACAGFSSDQRIQKNTSPDNDIPSSWGRGHIISNWKATGCLNNLKDVHQFYCPYSKPIEKDARNFFVKGTRKDIADNFQSLMLYCASDVYATFELFKNLFEIFIERFPHPVTLIGMLEMSKMYLPINQNWSKYKINCENSYNDTQDILKNLLEKSANEACEFVNEKSEDPWLFNLNWEPKVGKKAKAMKKKKKEATQINHFEAQFDFPNEKENAFLRIAASRDIEAVNDLRTIFNPSKAIQRAYNSAEGLYKNNPYLINYPEWYRELCSKPSDKDWMPGPNLVTTRMRTTPSLLRLSWNGHPLYYDEKNAWSYIIELESIQKHLGITEPDSEAEKATVKSKKKNTNKTLHIEKLQNGHDYVIEKIPHKDGEEVNVGNPLSKSFLARITEGTLASNPKRSAELALELYSNISYWENNEKRIRSQKPIWLTNGETSDSKNLVGAILPMTVVSGTITRRAVESTWLTASSGQKKNRIGGELKCMIQPPEGYLFVGADVDSQELWIASLFGDANFARMHGCTAISWMNLQGKKSDGTDIHTKTASMIGINRDQAKVFNYGRIYGAGRKFAEKLLLQFDPWLTESEAGQKAKIMFDNTKGKKVKVNKDVRATWNGGTESEMFNKLEEIAKQRRPRTPVLNAAITKCLQPDYVGDGFMTSRINWVVQSSAVDYLHIMLVCMEWLIEEYDIDARFSISIHDEVRYIVKEEDKYRAALALQLTNFYTRSLFCYKLGFDTLPMSIAFFSSVDIDKCLRKEPDLDFVSPSNPNGLAKGYGIKKGDCLDIYEIIEKTNGSLDKEVKSEYKTIKK